MAVTQGDIVRFEREGMWFYCRVDGLLDDGNIVCQIVEAQSWADLALGGYLPGRLYQMPVESVLSVVRHAAQLKTCIPRPAG